MPLVATLLARAAQQTAYVPEISVDITVIVVTIIFATSTSFASPGDAGSPKLRVLDRSQNSVSVLAAECVSVFVSHAKGWF